MNCFLGRSEALKHNTLPWQKPSEILPHLNTRKLMGSLVWRSGDCCIHQITKWTGLWEGWVEIACLMMDLREIHTTWPQDVGRGIEIISWDIIEMPWISAHRWLGFSSFSSFSSQTDGDSSTPTADLRVGSTTLPFMTQICQFIFSGPFVKWDLHSTARCSHKRHYGSISSQSHFGDKCALFPLHSAVKPVRPDTLYIASKPHQIFLAAKHRQKPVPVSPNPITFTVLASSCTAAWGSPLLSEHLKYCSWQAENRGKRKRGVGRGVGRGLGE